MVLAGIALKPLCCARTSLKLLRMFGCPAGCPPARTVRVLGAKPPCGQPSVVKNVINVINVFISLLSLLSCNAACGAKAMYERC
eukprot:scaffold422876_cov28-Prasinocladus_malaysianus.AAC.1